MDNNIKKDTPESQQGDSAENGNIPRSERPPNILNRWMELLLQLGLGESALRLATNTLLLVAVVGVILLMQGFYKDAPNRTAGESALAAEPKPTLAVELDDDPLPLNVNSRGLPRMAMIYTTIPSRPRLEITIYTNIFTSRFFI